MTNPWTEAWEEAEASLPPDVTVIATIELRHPAFLDESDNPIAIRAASGVHEDIDLTLEDGAFLNGGETVTFKAIPFFAERPEMGEGKMPESQVTVDNVAREMVPIIEKAAQIRADLTVTFREYRSDDSTEPCFGPVEFVMRKVKMSGSTITGLAQLDNLVNKKFPSRAYTIPQFPALLA